MSKVRDLASRPDLSFGPLSVSPSRRRLSGPAGEVQLEPLIIQVLLVLLDSEGRVVTRDQLFEAVWGGTMVGDDSLNRAIARVRGAVDKVAPGLVEIETIPRTGYRATGEWNSADRNPATRGASGRAISRRTVLASGAAALVIGGAGLWTVRSDRSRRFEQLTANGVRALESGDTPADSISFLREAVSIRPDDARANGYLGYALLTGTDGVFARGVGTDVELAESAANKALAVDPHQPEAQLARLLLQRPLQTMGETERGLREILAGSPNNIFVLRELWNLLQCGGRSREGLALVERAIAVKPMVAANNFPRAQFLWITGRIAEADRVADTAMRYWPDHRYVRFARFMILAFTGRPGVALEMLDNGFRPQNFSPASVELWRLSLPVLENPASPARDEARRANVEAASKNPQLTAQAVMTLSELGDSDSAFDAANKLLLFRQGVRARDQAASRLPVKSTAWRFTPWLFTPPCKAMRADPRFAELCSGIGLTDYWQSMKVRPDYLDAST